MNGLIFSGDELFELEYWKKKLRGISPNYLSTDYVRPAQLSDNKQHIKIFVEKEVKEQLGLLSKKNDVSLFTTLLSAFKILLFRYSNQGDICVGNAVYGNKQNEASKSAKERINILALRDELVGDELFTDLLKRVNNTIVEAYKHQKTPFEKIVSGLVKNTVIDTEQFFQVMFLMRDNPGADTDEFDFISQQTLKYDLTFILSETPSGINITIEYATDLFLNDTIEKLSGHYQQVLKSIVEGPEKSVGSLPILTYAEAQDVLVNFNNTITKYPNEKTIVDLFEEQVIKTPDNVALRQFEDKLTYNEVNKQANQLAGYLVSNGVRKGDNIGIIVTRGFDMIVGMYGIMKAGAAYVPIDPEYPIERQEYILKNSSVTKVISDGDYELKKLLTADQFVKLNSIDFSEFSTENPGIKVDSKELAYTIYTSGSTGRPKGVMIEHHSVINLILWVNTQFNVGADDRLLFVTSMCFDLSVYDIFGLLSSGGSIVIVKQDELMDVSILKDMLIRYDITFWDSVPTTMAYLVRELEDNDYRYLQHKLRVVFMSGDWIPVNLPDRIKKYFPNANVISLGGATEGTVWSNFYKIGKVKNDWSSIPYGKPLNNNFFYILNEQLQPVPIGVTGELYIGGVGVARGYANDEQKTNYSFVKDPFNGQAGGKMYRTGDLGRMLPDLNMEFIGRKDEQVKIRGFRIELGEIESVLRQSEMISEAAVVTKSDKEGKKALAAYVVGNNLYNRDAVISFLQSKLPAYMVPALWMELDNLPLTSNGKIDKKAFPEFDTDKQTDDNFLAPGTEQEKVLAEIWQDVLRIKKISINDNFFNVGGHSLLAVQIMTKIEKKTGKKFSIAILYKYPSVKLLSEFIEKDNTESVWKSLVPIKPSGNKTPLYIVHGAGLNVLSFSGIALHVDSEQPIYGLQGKGLNGMEPPFNCLAEIAKHYVTEIVEQNPTGPYAIAGYSIGAFIAIEMVREFNLMNKKVKTLLIIDTDAERTKYQDQWFKIWPKRQFPELYRFSRNLIMEPRTTIRNCGIEIANQIRFIRKPESREFYIHLEKVKKEYSDALNKYKLMPFDNKVYLIRARTSVHFTKDLEHLGWTKYALKGVEAYPVEGDHFTMFSAWNVKELASALQNVLKNS